MNPWTTVLEEVLAEAHAAGLVQDAAIAQSGREADSFWFLRENIPRAQRLDGASLKHDISCRSAPCRSSWSGPPPGSVGMCPRVA